MIPRLPFSLPLLAIVLFLVGTSAQDTEDDEHHYKFGYTGAIGPEKWGSLSKSFLACSNGKKQSPVNIETRKVVRNKNLTPLTRDYDPENVTLVNHGYIVGMKLEVGGPVAGLIVDGKNFTLKQMHWHTPSEHRINGIQFPAELHLVHQATDGTVSVVGIIFKYGKADPLLSKIKVNLDSLAKKTSAGHEEAHIAVGDLNTRHITRKTRKYYRYIGSLTTPPCTENIIWNVLGKVRTISKEQVEALKAPLNADCKDNARPAQPLNGRVIQLYDELGAN